MKIGMGLQIGRTAANPNLVAPGTFEGTIESWNPQGGAPTSVGGELIVTASGADYAQAQKVVTGLQVGTTYVMRAQGRRGTTAQPVFISIAAGVNATTSSATATDLSAEWTATTTSTTLAMGVFDVGATGTAIFDNVSIRRK